MSSKEFIYSIGNKKKRLLYSVYAKALETNSGSHKNGLLLLNPKMKELWSTDYSFFSAQSFLNIKKSLLFETNF